MNSREMPVRPNMEHYKNRAKEFSGTSLDWALHGWSDPPTEADGKHYYEVVKLLINAGAIVDAACRQKAGNDSRMLALFKG